MDEVGSVFGVDKKRSGETLRESQVHKEEEGRAQRSIVVTQNVTSSADAESDFVQTANLRLADLGIWARTLCTVRLDPRHSLWRSAQRLLET
jgi:hypothetical protein